MPGIQFGLAFCEASGDCLVRHSGTDATLESWRFATPRRSAPDTRSSSFSGTRIPINVLAAMRNVVEVCSIFCATANPLQVVIAETAQGRGILGVIDGASPKGVEDESGTSWRKAFLRKIGYKL